MDSTQSTVSILKITKLEPESENNNNNTSSNTTFHKWSPLTNSNCSPDELARAQAKISPSGSNSSSVFCRICHEGDGVEKLFAPCRCTGTVGLIHATCLEHWLTSSNSDKCEICKFAYKTLREPRSCFDYLRDNGNQYNVRNLIADIVCFFLLTPLLIISTYLCILGAHQYLIRERWEAIGLIILAIFLLAVYLTWCHVTLRFHCSVCKSWQSSNQHVRLESLSNYNMNNDSPNVAITVEEGIRNQIIVGIVEEFEELNEIDCDTNRIIT